MNSNYLAAGVYGGGVFRSSNGGTTWLTANSGMDNPYVRAVIADPKNGGVLYAASVYGLYKSVDTAKTWQKLSAPEHPARFSLAVQQQPGRRHSEDLTG